MKEVYEKLHEDKELWVEEKRRAREFQAGIIEAEKNLKIVKKGLDKKDEALKAALEWIEGDDAGMFDFPDEWEAVRDKVKKALEA